MIIMEMIILIKIISRNRFGTNMRKLNKHTRFSTIGLAVGHGQLPKPLNKDTLSKCFIMIKVMIKVMISSRRKIMSSKRKMMSSRQKKMSVF